MTLNPYDSPLLNQRPVKPLWWWLAAAYAMPLLIMLTMLNQDGWYGTGSTGSLQASLRLVAFLAGTASAYYVLICGSVQQKVCSAPAALAYAGLMLAIGWEHYL